MSLVFVIVFRVRGFRDSLRLGAYRRVQVQVTSTPRKYWQLLVTGEAVDNTDHRQVRCVHCCCAHHALPLQPKPSTTLLLTVSPKRSASIWVDNVTTGDTYYEGLIRVPIKVL